AANTRNDSKTGDDDTAHDGFMPPSGLHGHEQTDAQIGRCVDSLSIGLEKPIGDAEVELAQYDALQIDDIFHFLDGGYDHAGEFHFSNAESAALSRRPQPAHEKAQHLPE